jgi:Lrp/AsnC family transcriptional regulator of lysine biosynthesis
LEGTGMRGMDETDQKILTALKLNSRIPFTKIAEEVELSEAAVRKRVERLQEDGVIRRFTVEVEEGGAVRAIILISVQPAYPTPSVVKGIKKVKGIERVFEVAGEVDVLAIASGKSVDEVNANIDEVRKIEGVSKTNSMIILRAWV